MRGGLPLVRLEGDPGELGVQHGRTAKARVAHNVRAYLRRFQDGGLSREEVRRRAEAYRRVIEDANGEYAAIVEGIAEGSGQDPLDIVAINVRYEIMYSEFVRSGIERELSGTSMVGGCTSLAVLPDNVSNGHLLMGQNWDWIPEVRGVVLRVRPEDGPDVLAFTEAGIAGAKFGLNSEGLGLAINGLVSNLDSWSRLRKPFHVRCWEILRAHTLEEAVRAVTGTERACSANFLIAKVGDGRPQVVDVEAAPEAERLLSPADGFLAHTNHFLDSDSVGVWQPLAEDRVSTFHRSERIHELLRSLVRRGGARVDDLKRALRDHDGSPVSVCHHPDPARPPAERFETVASAVLDLDVREMYVASGNPCTARYRRYSLVA